MNQKDENKEQPKTKYFLSIVVLFLTCASFLAPNEGKIIYIDPIYNDNYHEIDNGQDIDINQQTNENHNELAYSLGLLSAKIIPASNYAVCHEQKRFARVYFKNLEIFYPVNNVGNCGYVSIAMLLSYYSLLWTPFFMPACFKGGEPCDLTSIDDENFESPGVVDYPNINLWNGEISYPSTIVSHINEAQSGYEYAVRNNQGNKIQYWKDQLDYWNYEFKKVEDNAYRDYIGRMIELKSTSIIGYLYDLATRTSYPNSAEGDALLDLESNPRLGMNLEKAKCLIEAFLEENNLDNYVVPKIRNYMYFNEEEYSFDRHNQLMADEVNYVYSGKPIIFGGRLYDADAYKQAGGGHIAIAYDYCEESGDIYGHKGWKGNEFRHINFSSEFRYFDDYLYLEISSNLKHNHSRVFRINGSKYCSCELASHDHYFTEWYDYGHPMKHARQCSCGEMEYSPHSFSNTLLKGRKCIYCGKTFNSSSNGGLIL